MQITQLADEATGRYSYLIVDDKSRQALLIDPVEAQIQRDLALLRERKLTLAYVVETRKDPSGMSGAELLRDATGARFAASDLGTPSADIILRQGDYLEVGALRVDVLETPGEDGDGLSYRVGDQIFAGDAVAPSQGDDRLDDQAPHPALWDLPATACLWPGRAPESEPRRPITAADSSPGRRRSNAEPGVLGRIGNTPLIELRHVSPNPRVRIFAKLEGCNPSGSIKDRIALGLVREAERRGDLEPGMTIVEASTGNTAIALAMVARQLGYSIKVMVPEGVPPSIWDTLELLDAQIDWCKPCAGMRGAIEHARREAVRLGGYALRQFSNPLNVDIHYEQTGAELDDALDHVDVFVSGIGTGGTITGVGRRLRETNPGMRIVGVEPATGERLQGLQCIEDAFAPPLFDIELLNRRLRVTAAHSLEVMRMVGEREGLVVGVSSGATLSAAIREAQRLDRGNIVVMFSDGGWKYLPTRPWEAVERHDAELDEVHWW
ncbi:MAG: pyridoxal-phosphate dependent enzyme [Myxococcales bacterium]|nr:pyridoxal-phosphate dependent enzyme [Myxococcales bacterium]